MRGNQGFSLIEAMIGIVIMGVAGTAMTTYMTNLADQQAILESKMDMRGLMGEVTTALTNASLCKAMFENSFRFNALQAAEASPKGMVVPGLVLPNGEIARPGATLQRYALTVEDIKLSNAQAISPTSYRVTLEAQFSGKARNVGLKRQILGSVIVNTDASNAIVSCSNSALASGGAAAAASAAQATCASIGGFWSDSPPNAAVYAPGSGHCYICPGGTFKGFSVHPSGEVITNCDVHSGTSG